MNCPRCYEPIKIDSNFCNRCGAKIEIGNQVIKNINGMFMSIDPKILEEDIIIVADDVQPDILGIHFKDGIDRTNEWGYSWCHPDKIPNWKEIDTDPNVQSKSNKHGIEEIKYLNKGELVLCRAPKRLMDARKQYDAGKSYQKVFYGMTSEITSKYNRENKSYKVTTEINRSDGLQDKIGKINRNVNSLDSLLNQCDEVLNK